MHHARSVWWTDELHRQTHADMKKSPDPSRGSPLSAALTSHLLSRGGMICKALERCGGVKECVCFSACTFSHCSWQGLGVNAQLLEGLWKQPGWGLMPP
jgi:hypothetical protein